MPTKADLDAVASRIERSLRREIEDLRQQTSAMDSKIVSFEQSNTSLDQRVSRIESSLESHNSQLIENMLHTNDLENPSSLLQTTTEVVSTLLGQHHSTKILIDRIHRVSNRAPRDQQAPWDTLFRVHYITVKEKILTAAWGKGPTHWKRHIINILPDLSRHTLAMRCLLRPLEKIKNTGAIYHWGYPFHLIIKKGDSTFLLKTPEDLRGGFVFPWN